MHCLTIATVLLGALSSVTALYAPRPPILDISEREDHADSQGFALAPASSTSSPSSGSGAPMWQLSSDPEFSFILEANLALANNEGAATGEILRAASQIAPGDFESFYQEFFYLANQMQSFAGQYTDRVSIREAMFRAASYYRAADFYLHGNQSDPRIDSLWNSQLACYNKAISLLDYPATRYNLTGPGFKIPIIFYTPSNDSTPKGTVLVGSGYDGSQEESYHYYCREVLLRGYNCVTYEGPGQPTVVREQHLGFIPNWWSVVTPVVDWLQTCNDVDASKIALVGISFGGALAPIAASREHRLAAVLVFDGLWNLAAKTEQQFPKELMALFRAGKKKEFDAAMNDARTSPQSPTTFKWFIDQGLWSFQTTSPFDWLTRFQNVNMTQKYANAINCPVFVGCGGNDNNTAGEPKKLADALGKKATYHLFNTDVGAGEHIQLGAEQQLAAVSLGWLSDVFKKRN